MSRPPRPRGRLDDRGAVTAELAMVLPLLVAVTIGLVWLLSVGAAEVRVIDAARETARSAARGDPDAVAVSAGARVAPDGSTVTLGHDGDQVVAHVEGRVSAPGGLFGFLGAVTVRADAVGLAEQDAGGP